MDRPKTYSRYNDLQRTDNCHVLDTYLGLLGRVSGDVLDVGSGDGRFAAEVLLPRLGDDVATYVGCDVSEAMVRHAEERYAAATEDDDVEGRRRMEFVVFDVTAEVVPEEFRRRFHHVVSFYTLHWIEKQRHAFRNIYDMLRPGGSVLLTFLASNPIYDVYENMSRNKRWKEYARREYIAPYHRSCDPERQLRRVLQETGFEIALCKIEKRSYTYPDLKVWEKSVKAVNPIVSKLPRDEVDDYMADFLEEARKLTSVTIESVNNNEETVVVCYDLFVVVASKGERT